MPNKAPSTEKIFDSAFQHYQNGNLQQAESLMKQGVDESYASGIRLDEWEDDGSSEFDQLWTQLQKNDWPIWE